MTNKGNYLELLDFQAQGVARNALNAPLVCCLLRHEEYDGGFKGKGFDPVGKPSGLRKVVVAL